MSDLVGGHGDGREGTALVLVRGQADRLGGGIVMIAFVGGFYADVLHAEFVEQETRQLRTRALVPVGRIAVALDDPADPEAGPENQGEQHDDHHDKSHAVIVACLSGNE